MKAQRTQEPEIGVSIVSSAPPVFAPSIRNDIFGASCANAEQTQKYTQCEATGVSGWRLPENLKRPRFWATSRKNQNECEPHKRIHLNQYSSHVFYNRSIRSSQPLQAASRFRGPTLFRSFWAQAAQTLKIDSFGSMFENFVNITPRR